MHICSYMIVYVTEKKYRIIEITIFESYMQLYIFKYIQISLNTAKIKSLSIDSENNVNKKE